MISLLLQNKSFPRLQNFTSSLLPLHQMSKDLMVQVGMKDSWTIGRLMFLP